MKQFRQLLSLVVGTTQAVSSQAPTQSLSTADRFQIFSEMNTHQAYIDLPGTCANSKLYSELYWPDGSFQVIDAKSGRNLTVSGPKAFRGNFDYAHSVFPLDQWLHSMGVFQIHDAPAASSGALRASAHWNWRVDWKANQTGVVSTGFYDDVFEKREGEWKVLHRVSQDDPNWPIQTFWPFIVNEDRAFVSSCGDTSL